MSGLVSEKEAKLAWANGAELQVAHITMKEWEILTDNYMLSVFDNGSYIFRLKPRTITINGIEVPAPFEPKVGDYVYFLCSDETKGYAETTLEDTPMNWGFVQFGAWRTEDEIKQVVSALRSVFKGGV